jgi:hypothetical protein
MIGIGMEGMGLEGSYANEHPLALEVDVSDGELVGERHDCCFRMLLVDLMVLAAKRRAYLYSV